MLKLGGLKESIVKPGKLPGKPMVNYCNSAMHTFTQMILPVDICDRILENLPFWHIDWSDIIIQGKRGFGCEISLQETELVKLSKGVKNLFEK